MSLNAEMATLVANRRFRELQSQFANAAEALVECIETLMREDFDLRARLAAAEKLNEEARANGLADMIAQRNAALKKLAAAETRASMARLDDSQRDELAACKLALAAAAEKERDEARAELATVEHQRDAYRAERAEALAAMRGEALRECLQRIEYRLTGEDPLIVIKARAALSGDTGEWLAAERLRAMRVAKTACRDAADAEREAIDAIDLSALLEKLS